MDDASTDDTRTQLAALKSRFPMLRVLGHRNNAGQSRAIMNGVLAARAPVIGTLDGDGQNNPAFYLVRLYFFDRRGKVGMVFNWTSFFVLLFFFI